MALRLCCQPRDDVSALGLVSKLNAFLDNIASEFVLRIPEKLLLDHLNHERPILFLARLNYMLNHIIAILILNKPWSTGTNLSKYGPAINIFTKFKHPLDNAAPVRVSRLPLHLAPEGVDQAFCILSGNVFEDFLYHMVPMLALNTLEDLGLNLSH